MCEISAVLFCFHAITLHLWRYPMRETFLRTQQVCDRLNISATTLWRWRKAGHFPDAKSLPGSSIQGWAESTVDNWISQNFGVKGGEL
ncbi:AlpA family transcriptional regulator [Cellvibrio sp. KY-YJ-3]|uniref:helix-turn-helix transcriptional regulator n=1 Tax=Cellvibrio sp. KY-YJ-3 TaxID=454662 RepID=UPI001246D940|nr:AlpA family phage regulatory protein [Cellvibrio sp. KY-YJ-3]